MENIDCPDSIVLFTFPGFFASPVLPSKPHHNPPSRSTKAQQLPMPPHPYLTSLHFSSTAPNKPPPGDGARKAGGTVNTSSGPPKGQRESRNMQNTGETVPRVLPLGLCRLFRLFRLSGSSSSALACTQKRQRSGEREPRRSKEGLFGRPMAAQTMHEQSEKAPSVPLFLPFLFLCRETHGQDWSHCFPPPA